MVISMISNWSVLVMPRYPLVCRKLSPSYSLNSWYRLAADTSSVVRRAVWIEAAIESFSSAERPLSRFTLTRGMHGVPSCGRDVETGRAPDGEQDRTGAGGLENPMMAVAFAESFVGRRLH